jgi:putative DNA primase/helicase
LAPLAALAEKYRVAIVAVMHLTKNEDRRAIARGNGSIAFVAAARIVLLLVKDHENEDRRLLAGVKNNLGPIPSTRAFKIVGEPACTVWEKESVQGADADSLLRPAAGQERRSKIDEAEQFLLQYLADGAKPVDDVKAAAAERNISDRTLERAAKNLHVIVWKAREHRGQWYWELPQPKHANGASHAEQATLAVFEQPHDVPAESEASAAKVAKSPDGSDRLPHVEIEF